MTAGIFTPDLPRAARAARLATAAVGLVCLLGCSKSGDEAAGPATPTAPSVPAVSSSPSAPAPPAPAQAITLSPDAVTRAGIAVQPAVRRDFRVHRDFPATVRPNENELAEVQPLVRGRVVEVYVDVGQDTKKGAPLALLDSAELGQAQATFLKTEAKLHEAERAYERARDLLQDKAISLAEFQRREAEALSARSEAREARNRLAVLGMREEAIHQLTLDRTVRSSVPIQAPFAGRVIARNITRGEVVETTEHLFTVADLSDVWIVANVPEKDVRLIKASHDVEIRLTAYPHDLFHGRITYVGDVLDPATRTMKLRVTAPNPGGKLKPEMFATVRVYADPEPHVLAVPLSAVLRDGGNPIIFVQLQPGRFEARTVALGEENGEAVKVLSGLREGESVVTAGAFALKSEAEKYKIEPVR